MGVSLRRTLASNNTCDEDHQRKLVSDPGYMANWSGWEFLTDAGLKHGWKPLGTVQVHIDNWNGGYYTNDGQIVTAADAKAWADALESGKPYDKESLRWQKLIDDFIAYCRGGAFEIW